MIIINEKNEAKKSRPAAALISLSFKTGMLYSSTSSPNFIILFITFSFISMSLLIYNHCINKCNLSIIGFNITSCIQQSLSQLVFRAFGYNIENVFRETPPEQTHQMLIAAP